MPMTTQTPSRGFLWDHLRARERDQRLATAANKTRASPPASLFLPTFNRSPGEHMKTLSANPTLKYSLLLVALVVIARTELACAGDPVDAWIARLTDLKERGRAAYDVEALHPATDATIDKLIGALGHSDPYVRRNAASVLGAIGKHPNRCALALVESLIDPDEGVRQHAAVALRRLGQEAVPHLVKALTRKDRWPEEETERPEDLAGGSFQSAPPGNMPPPPVPAPSRASPFDRAADYAALALSGVPASDSELNSLENMLLQGDWETRGYALFVLSRIGLAGVPAIRRGLDDPDSVFRKFSLRALLWMKALDPSTISAMLRLLSDSEPDLQFEAASGLAAIEPLDEENVRSLRQMLHSSRGSVVLSAANVLSSVPDYDVEVARALLAIISGKGSRLRDPAVALLVSLAGYNPQVSLVLVEFLSTASPAVRLAVSRQAACMAPITGKPGHTFYGTRGQKGAKSLIAEITRGCLGGPKGDLAVQVGSGYPAPPTVPPLAPWWPRHQIKKRELSEEEMVAAENGFGAFLASLLQDEDKVVRGHAVEGLNSLITSSGIGQALLVQAAASNRELVEPTARILGRSNKPQDTSIEFLCRTASDVDEVNRVSAIESLISLANTDARAANCLRKLSGDAELPEEIRLLSAMGLLNVQGPSPEITAVLRELANNARDQSTALWASVGLVISNTYGEADEQRLQNEFKNPGTDKALTAACTIALSGVPPTTESDVAIAIAVASRNGLYFALDRIAAAAVSHMIKSFPTASESDRECWVQLAPHLAGNVPDAISIISLAMSDSSPKVRRAGQKAAGDRIAAGVATLHEIEAAMTGESRHLERVKAAVALAKLRPDRTAKAIRTIMDVAAEPMELGGFGADLGLPPTMPVDTDNRMAYDRGPFSDEVVTIGEEAIPALLNALTRPEISVRRLATACLLSLGACSPDAIEALSNAANDPDQHVGPGR